MTCITLQRKLEDTCGILIWSFATMMHPESILESRLRLPALTLAAAGQAWWQEAAAPGR